MNSLKTKSLGFTLATSLLLTGCAMSVRDASVIAAEREAALAAAQLMPDPTRYSTQTFEWRDEKRNRMVPVRLYLPSAEANRGVGNMPLIVFSHGIGGSREGYKYLGRSFAANGYASLHLQHVGSDRQLWAGNPFSLLSRLSGAAQESEAIERVQDLSFALDQLLASPVGVRIDRTRVVAAGHSYGANTSMLAAGAVVERDGRKIDLRDPRISAAILLSAPPFYGAGDPKSILGEIDIPTLHITATEDDIAIPGYRSGVADRLDVYRAMGAANALSKRASKALAVFNGGSHSIFTDRLGTGGVELNPKIKAATRDLALAFLQTLAAPDQQAVDNKSGHDRSLRNWQQKYAPLLASFEHVGMGN
jgi:dienelactone hydrolase